MDAASQTQMKSGAVYRCSILALVDLRSDKNEHGRQNQSGHGDSKRVHWSGSIISGLLKKATGLVAVHRLTGSE
jgi:hypothetical protein